MKVFGVAALAVVLGVASWAGVAYAGCGHQTPSSLVWLDVGGSRSPAAHTQIVCAETGQNTAHLGLSASWLGPGDGCGFSASLHNTGSQSLILHVSISESTGHGDPPFSKCYSFSLSAGPHGGKLNGGASYPYTFSVAVLSSATGSCLSATGLVALTFSGSPY